MRFTRFAAIAGVAALISACGGAERPAPPAADPATPPTAEQPGTPATAAPITGTVHEVRMLGDERGYRYEPANITIRQGDGIRWINVSGEPHDVSFAGEPIPAEGRAQLLANMPDQRTELTSQFFTQRGETYTVSFANVAPGRYPYHCVPHLAMGMRGEITVQ